MTLGMAPIDVVATRYYNQGTDASGKGMSLCISSVHI